MTKQTIIGWDPGLITGVAQGEFSDTEPVTITDFMAITYPDLRAAWPLMLEEPYDHVVAEVFKARTDNEFVPDLTGVRVEGILELAYGEQIVWRERTKKEQVSDDLLKEHGLWVSNDEVDWEDARDVNDAIIHILGYVAFDLRHLPTLRAYFK